MTPAAAWLAVFLAGLLEVVWALGLRYSDGLTQFWPSLATLGAIFASFALMGIAVKTLPFGTAYALWAGIGASGTMIVGILAFGEPADVLRIGSLLLIIAGVVGLRLTSA